MKLTLEIFKSIGKHSKGMAVLEAALTLPIICLLIFFILESMLVNQAQGALEAIAIECTFDFVTAKNTNNFQNIINRHLNGQWSIGRPENVHWYFVVYKDVGTMCSTPSKGGEDIIYDSTWIQFKETHVKHTGDLAVNATTPENGFLPDNTETTDTLSGKAFMLTFVYEYKFTNAFVSKFFSGGTNTNDHKHFWLWARGFGVCN